MKLTHYAIRHFTLRDKFATVCAALALSTTSHAMAESSDATYLPPSALAVAHIRPLEITGYPNFATQQQKLMPLEAIKAWGEEHLGIHPLAIEEIKVVFGMPMLGPPSYGIVIKTLEDFSPENLSPEIVSADEPTQIGGSKIYPLSVKVGPTPIFLETIDARTILVGDINMLKSMRNASDGAGPLATLAEKNPPGEADVQILFAAVGIRTLLASLANQLPSHTPNSLRKLSEIAPILNGARLRAKLNDAQVELQLELIADDEKSAKEIHRITQESVELGKIEFAKAATHRLIVIESKKLQDAWQSYYQRLPNDFAAMYPMKLSKDRVIIETTVAPAVIMPGIAAGLMLPAMQSTRTTAKRMMSSSNLTQLGLAMHNYESANKHLPPAAITSKSGAPLLSWRVALLPYVEEIQLYHQFKLDEPWDSPHNLPLLNKMPAIYADPNIKSPDAREKGLTSYHVPVGTNYLFKQTGKTKFHEATDGLSNTIMLMAGNDSTLRPWTAPDYLPIDKSNSPLDFFIQDERGRKMVTIVLGNGRVRKIPIEDINGELFQKMLTRNGEEPIQIP